MADTGRMRIRHGRVMHLVKRRPGGNLESQCRKNHPVKGVSGTIPRAEGPEDLWTADRYWYPDCPHCPADTTGSNPAEEATTVVPDNNPLPRRDQAAYPKREVAGIIGVALAGAQPGRRHPAQVASDRLGDAVSRWGAAFTGAELDMIGQIRHALEEIAEGKREHDV